MPLSGNDASSHTGDALGKALASVCIVTFVTGDDFAILSTSHSNRAYFKEKLPKHGCGRKPAAGENIFCPPYIAVRGF